MEHFLVQFGHISPLLIYLIIFIAVMIEGEFTLVFSGILIKNRNIEYADTLLVIIIALMIHDFGYWHIGHWLAKSKKEKFLGIPRKKFENTLIHFKQQNGFYIIASKFAWGLNRFVIIANGYFNTKLGHFLKYSLISGFIWSITFISLGYIFAEKTEILKKDIKIVTVSIALFLILIVFVEQMVRKAINKQANVKEEELPL